MDEKRFSNFTSAMISNEKKNTKKKHFNTNF